MKKRILSTLCVLALCLTLFPAAALADETARPTYSAGTGDGKFSPDNDCTRAQIVTFLYRANT